MGHETIELKDIALFTSRKETERKDKEKVGRRRRGSVIMSAVATAGG